ncbi:MAG: NCS2 family permease, partial [Oscillospiraceae bacterium]|nr:NCS2 family permease [Oscillospiraceae bacterium]
TALTTAVLFLLATLFSPLFTSIPSFATAPALIFVGFLMFEGISDLKFSAENLSETIPAYLCIMAMPLFYSISEGICLGVISYVILQVATGKAKKINPLMYILAILFVLKYVFL